MALKSTIFKIQISVANILINHYEDYNLILARHPSESDDRMMYRLIAFALHANSDLAFGKGLSNSEDPDLWQKTLDGRIENWVDLGQPDEKRIRQACGKANHIYIYSYQLAASKIWWDGLSHKIRTRSGLQMRQLVVSGEEPLSALVCRGMKISCTIEDNEIFISGEDQGGRPINLYVAVKPYEVG